jgi:RimJ/RimL family protein N-acetyltransferase
MAVLGETKRLILRHIEEADADFILKLLNEPAFIQNIGDRGLRSLTDARRYIATGPGASYAQHGFGLFLVQGKSDQRPMGICGLLKRETLDDIDLGFALLGEYEGQGIAQEAALACLEFARRNLQLSRVVAITLPSNSRSIRLLEKLGFSLERHVTMPGDREELLLLAKSL